MSSSYIDHWNDKFASRPWGRYPPEELVRFIGRSFKNSDRTKVRALEIGCGPGANIWFLHREGFRVHGIDGSSAGIELAKTRLEKENVGLNDFLPDLRVGNFEKLPWANESMDVIIDVFSLYANTIAVIEATINEVERVLVPGGRFFSKLWGTQTTGFKLGKEIEHHTYDEIPVGPCASMGVSHFFDLKEIHHTFRKFEINFIDKILRVDGQTDSVIEEFVCVFTKPK